MTKCIFSIGSVTHAIKAQRALSDYSVPSKIVKTKTLENGRGCTYGIELDSGYRSFAAEVLKRFGIPYRSET